MNTRYSDAQDLADKKYQQLEAKLNELDNKINIQRKREAYKGIAFISLPFILIAGNDALMKMFEYSEILKEVKLSILTIILLILFAIFRSYYKRIK